MGWPKQTADLKRFHPTQVLETGYDILPFWVARMILMTTYAMKEVPFEKVYLHGMVRDEQGRKLSKSLGNGIDPLEVSAKYGTDAVRLSLVIGTAPGADSRIWDEKIAGFRNFTNKLWNISRFVLTSVDAVRRVEKRPKAKTMADFWIISRLQHAAWEATKHLENLDFSAAGELLRDFTWNEFADWYLEIAKIQMQDPELRESTSKILLYALENILKLWHPFMPFVTEAIWGNFTGDSKGKKFLMIEKWYGGAKANVSKDFPIIQDVIRSIRNIRSEYRVEPAKKIDAWIIAGKHEKMLKENESLIKMLARVENVVLIKPKELPTDAEFSSIMASGIEIHLPLAELVDAAKERERLSKERANLENYVRGLEAKLANPEFAAKAPPAIIEKSRASLAEKKEELRKVIEGLEKLA